MVGRGGRRSCLSRRHANRHAANSGPRRVGKPATAQPIEADLVTTQRINHWWQRFCQLSPEEAERVEDAALAQANPVTTRTYARLKQKGSRLFESVRMSLVASFLERRAGQADSQASPAAKKPHA